MIEVLTKKEKLLGYVKGKEYYDEKGNLIGFLEGNTYKMRDGYPILTLDDDKYLIDEDNKNIGYLEENFFRFPDSWIYKSGLFMLDRGFSIEKGELYNHKGKVIGFVRGNVESLIDLDYFGILVAFYDLGA
ncbi:MAG: hypothetical protein ACFFA3_20290 [Promethearchaeota archaeon]